MNVALLALFFFNDTATTEIYTLSLHDALPISRRGLRIRGRHQRGQSASRIHPGGEEGDRRSASGRRARGLSRRGRQGDAVRDRKSTRLNSSHLVISYAVFCLKKKT